jgi:hypothetical protein
MKECDKWKSHISSKLHMICVSSNNVRHPVTKTFTTLHPTTFHFLSFKLHPTTLHYPLIWLNPTDEWAANWVCSISTHYMDNKIYTVRPTNVQGGSNMTGTCAARLHTNQSWSYLNHLVQCEMFVYHLPTSFDRSRGHHQGNLQDYKGAPKKS